MEQVVEYSSEAVSKASYSRSHDPDARPKDASTRSPLDTSRSSFYTEGGSPIFFQREVISGCPAWAGITLLALLIVLSLIAR